METRLFTFDGQFDSNGLPKIFKLITVGSHYFDVLVWTDRWKRINYHLFGDITRTPRSDEIWLSLETPYEIIQATEELTLLAELNTMTLGEKVREISSSWLSENRPEVTTPHFNQQLEIGCTNSPTDLDRAKFLFEWANSKNSRDLELNLSNGVAEVTRICSDVLSLLKSHPDDLNYVATLALIELAMKDFEEHLSLCELVALGFQSGIAQLGSWPGTLFSDWAEKTKSELTLDTLDGNPGPNFAVYLTSLLYQSRLPSNSWVYGSEQHLDLMAHLEHVDANPALCAYVDAFFLAN